MITMLQILMQTLLPALRVQIVQYHNLYQIRNAIEQSVRESGILYTNWPSRWLSV